MKILIYIVLSLPLFAQTFKEDVEKYLAEKFPGYVKIEVENTNLTDTNANIVTDASRDPKVGIGTVLIPIIRKDRQNRKSFISVKLNLFYEALVAKKYIDRKEILDSSSFDTSLVNISGTIGKISPVDFDLTYYRTITFISKGEVLKEEKIELVPAINPGDKVSAEIRFNQVVLISDAVARQQGNAGDIIQIICNNRIFKAKVLDSKKVRIE